MPESDGHAAAIEAIAPDRRLGALHHGHLIEPNEIDRKFLTGEVVERGTLTGTRAQIAERLLALQAEGATAVLYQPGGSDIPRELQAFWEAAQMADFTAPAKAVTAEAVSHA
jgi:5,10-methylenetetrahydromethanopterin reductase